ncbi:MAG TPA: maleylpyruvate isomerase N-terminal domain-containing protein [Streptosporangiaceae bacterium]
MSNPRTLDYLGHLARESALFGHAIDSAAQNAPVPTCPQWTADDLLWHLGEVQWFWGTIVRERTDAAGAEAAKPPRPDGRAALMDFYLSASTALGSALAAASPDDPAWTWADDKTVGFIIRRQAHEALIHRVDAELTAGQPRSLMDPGLAADGVDEVLRVMYGGDLPAWGSFAPGRTGSVAVVADDAATAWLAEFGQFTGTDPGDGKSYDQPGIKVTVADPDAAAVTGAAALIRGDGDDLDCWLWRRPVRVALDRSGDPAALAALDALLAAGIS